MKTNINSSAIDLSNQDKLVCPKCSERCNMEKSFIKFNKNNPDEFESIICQNCSFQIGRGYRDCP